MRITHLTAKNYKSLRSIDIAPEQLTIIVGANASGKTNFADCIDFIAEVYRHGLEVAIARKGGYENIAFRKMRRSKQAVTIDICVELERSDYEFYIPPNTEQIPQIQVQHTFSFAAHGYSIRAEFEVIHECITVKKFVNAQWKSIVSYERNRDKIKEPIIDNSASKREKKKNPDDYFERLLDDVTDLKYFKYFVSSKSDVERQRSLPTTELLMEAMPFFSILRVFSRAVERIKVFQISPTKSREFGVPTPTPEMDRFGENLPAVIDLMRKQNKEEWGSVMEAMRNVLPDLKSIDVDYTSSRTLGLFFNEEGIGRPWNVAEVSDGTIQTLALLVAIFDPHSSAIVLEEPENSVHPWIIRNILKACHEAAKRKQIIITTHSPIVINSVKPKDVWVIWRAKGESYLSNLAVLDPDFLSLWEGGEIPTFDYIDSGALPKAIPPAPQA